MMLILMPMMRFIERVASLQNNQYLEWIWPAKVNPLPELQMI